MRKIIKIYVIILTIIIFFGVATKSNSEDWKSLYDATKQKIENKDYPNAITLAKQTIEQAKIEFENDYTDSPQLNRSIEQLAEIYFMMADYENAIIYFKQEKDLIANSKAQIDSEEYTTCINNLSVSYQALNRYLEAEPLLKEALLIKEKNFGKNNESYAKSLNNLGQLYQSLGKFSDAESLYSEALAIKKNVLGEDNLSYSISLLNLAILQYELGNYEESIKNLEKAYPTLQKYNGESNPETIKAMFYLAKSYIITDQFSKAVPLLSKTEEYYQNYKKTNSLDYAEIQYYNSMLYIDLKDYQKADLLLNNARDLIFKLSGKNNPQYADCLNALGIVNWILDNKDLAYNYLYESVQIKRIILGENHPGYANSLNVLAGLLKEFERYDEAEKYYKESFQLYLNMIKNYFPFLSEREKSNFYTKLKQRFEMFDCFVLNRKDANPNLISDMYNYQIATKGIVVSSMKKIRQKLLNTNDKKLIEKFDKWRDTKEDISRLYNLSTKKLKNVGVNIDSLDDLANSLEKEISSSSSAILNDFYKAKISWQDIKKKLGPDDAAIEIVRFKYYVHNWCDSIIYVALIITAESKEHPNLVVMKSGKELEDVYYHNYKNSIIHIIPDNDSYKAFWEEIDNNTLGKKNIYLSQDGIFNKINVNSLKIDDNKYVIDEKNIILVSNTADILNIQNNFNENINNINKKQNIYLVGNPQFQLINEEPKKKNINEIKTENKFSNLRSLNLYELPGTKLEIESIKKIISNKLNNIELFTAQKATVTNVKSINNPSILHLATHGFFLTSESNYINQDKTAQEFYSLENNPLLRSGLFFTGSKNYINSGSEITPGDNGILTALDAMNLNLDKTSLVVLSACETGLGEIKNGEGVYGLQRAFQIAGAKTLIMSLWKVDDKASQELMSEFYLNWSKGEDFYTAFRKAQITLKNKYEHPYYWGAFIMNEN